MKESFENKVIRLFPKAIKVKKGFVVICPLHQEITPSCFIEKRTETFHCFGCGRSGELHEITGVSE